MPPPRGKRNPQPTGKRYGIVLGNRFYGRQQFSCETGVCRAPGYFDVGGGEELVYSFVWNKKLKEVKK